MKLSFRSNASGFSPLTVIVALLVSVVALAGVGVLSAYAPELRSGNDGGAHALSKAATGFGGLPPLLRRLGTPVVLDRRGSPGTLGDSLLVLTPTPRSDPKEVGKFRDHWPVLIVLPKWETEPAPLRRGWVRTVEPYSHRASMAPLPRDIRAGMRFTERKGRVRLELRRPKGQPFGRPVVVENARTLTGPGWVPVVVDQFGGAVLALHDEAGVYVLTDPDLISTHGLKSADGARTAVALLEILKDRDSPVVFDLTLHGMHRTQNLLRLLLEPPLLGMTLVLVALAILAGVQAAIRFGPAREKGRAIALGKSALAQNTASLVRLARREHHMARPYALLVRAAVARAIGAPRTLSDAELDAFLDRVSRIMGASSTYTALAEQARAAKTPVDLMQVAAALYRWNQELTRARQ